MERWREGGARVRSSMLLCSVEATVFATITACAIDQRTVAVVSSSGGDLGSPVGVPGLEMPEGADAARPSAAASSDGDTAASSATAAPSDSSTAAPSDSGTAAPGESEGTAPSAPAADPCAGLPLGSCECTVGAATTCGAEYSALGTCGERTLECQLPGVWPAADACLPYTEERCTEGRLDEDCDGEVDEGCECINFEVEACGVEGVGGKHCRAGVWGACVCPGTQLIDVDGNGVDDATETLIADGTLLSSRNGWEFPAGDGVDTPGASEDGTALACSGALQIMTLEDPTPAGTGLFHWVTNYGQTCVESTARSVAAFVEAQLVMNTGDQNGSLEFTGVDPSQVSLGLSAFEGPDCGGEPLAEREVLVELQSDFSQQRIEGTLMAGSPTQSWRIRLTVVGDGVDGAQSTGVRLVQFRNVLLRPL